ncbi:FHA domain-containing protein [Streptomyces sp. NPDC093510]|uniref:FHA domain-containing protein n=1 Tax=Streptomyces sp. NPDC093510 TaxID=3155199 RepID=UPI00341BD7E8
MPTCPNGHQSGSDDWCEVCGHRMAGAVPPPPPPPPPAGYGYPPPQPGQDPGFPQPAPGRPHLAAVPEPAPEAQLCPQCRTPREANAPFCEECRWNFLTNTATSYTPAAPNPPLPGTHGGPGPGPVPGRGPGGPGMPQGPNPAQQFSQPPPGYEYQGSRPSQMNRPAEPIPPFGNGGGGGGGQQGPGPQGPGPQGSRPPGAGPQGPGPQGPGQPFPGQPGPGAQGPGQPFPGQSGPQGQGSQGPGPQGPGPQGSGPQGPGPGQAPPGAPQAFQQPGPPAPPAFPQETGAPQGPPPPPPGPSGPGGPGGPGSGGPSFGGGTDDWVISPPSSPAQQEPVQQEPFQPQESFQQESFQPQQPERSQGPGTWTVTIGPDREYFMAMMQRSGPEASGLNLPAYSPEQQRPLSGNQISIGRRRHSTGDTPDIDLSVPPEDPGVSHQHAVLVHQPDGSWAVVDQNSTNGTTVNGGEEPIQPFVPVPLQDGDQVHVGAWTTLTIRRD